MAVYEQRRWVSDPTGLTRRDRRPCNYDVYLPDTLAGRRFVLDGSTAADVADAEAALVRLNASAEALADTESLARLLLRAESVASSRIEGLDVGGRLLLRADAARRFGKASRDVTADEVLGNIDAMVWGIESVGPGGAVTLGVVLEAHRRLLAGTRLDEHAGRIRTEQNWIGGSGYNPCSAAFVPPPPEEVHRLLDDLVRFCNDDTLPALAQAAVAHAQFETIHPFVDGNGRTGRVLLHLVLRRRGLAPRVLPPVSLVLATWARDYVAGLTATRYAGAPDSPQAHEGTHRDGCRSLRLGEPRARCQWTPGASRSTFRALQASWREARRQIARREDSAAQTCSSRRFRPRPCALGYRPPARLTGRRSVARRRGTGRSSTSWKRARAHTGQTWGGRNRAFDGDREVLWKSHAVLVLTALERQLASPAGDTRVSPPVRRVPRRSP